MRKARPTREKPLVDGYVRVSTDEQAKEGMSLGNQEARIRAYCDALDVKLHDVLSDEGESGKTLERAGIQRVLSDIRRGVVDGIVIYNLSRLTRSLRDWNDLIEEFFSEKAGRRLLSVNDSIDTKTAGGRLVLNVLVTVYQWEREIIAERTSDALQGKIRRGERCGRVRYGYDVLPKVDPSDRKEKARLVANPVEQAIIERMREWESQGMTYAKMVAMLHELGIETKEPGRLWNPGTIHRILSRPIA